MADSTAGGYNPGASMLQTNPDVSLKVFMGGGGADADGGAGMAYNDTASLLRTVPGVELQKFDGGAMRVPGADGQGRLLQDVLGITEVIPKVYDEKNNVIRSLDDLRAAFRETGRYNEFIDWLGGKLLNNDLFKKFVADRMLTIGTKAAAPRAKRRTRDQIIADELQKSIKKIVAAQAELVRLEKVKTEADSLLENIRKTGETGEQLKQAEAAKRRTETAIAQQQKALTTTIATSTAIPNMGDAELEALDSKVEGEIATIPVAATSSVVPRLEEVRTAPPVQEQLEVVVSPEPAASPVPVASSVPVASPVPVASSGEQQIERTNIVNIPVLPASTQGGARKAKRTLKSRPKKGRNTLKRK